MKAQITEPARWKGLGMYKFLRITGFLLLWAGIGLQKDAMTAFFAMLGSVMFCLGLWLARKSKLEVFRGPDFMTIVERRPYRAYGLILIGGIASSYIFSMLKNPDQLAQIVATLLGVAFSLLPLYLAEKKEETCSDLC